MAIPGRLCVEEMTKVRPAGLGGRSAMTLLTLGALSACGHLAPVPEAAAIQPQILSPSDGAALSVSPWVPVTVHLPADARGATLSWTLDGQPWRDDQALLRRRNGHIGGGQDYLATLELLDLAPGAHTLDVLVTPPGRWPYRLQSTFTYDPPPHLLTLHVQDAAGTPVSARVALWRGEERHLLAGPDATAADRGGRDHLLSSVFAVNGVARLRLEPGDYRFVAVRSLRDDLGVGALTIDGDQTLTLTVPEVIATPGVWTADLHVHSGYSPDSFTPNQARFAALACAGLDAIVLTEHNWVVDPTPRLAAVGAADTLRGIPGAEIPVHGKSASSGHLNAFPLGVGAEVPGGLSLAATLDRYRAIAEADPWPDGEGRLLLMLNHPRGIQFRPDSQPARSAHGLFTSLGFDRAIAPGVGENAWMTVPEPTGTTALDIDLLEIVNRFSWTLYREVRQDWFALLEAGYAVVGTGNSDSHAVALELAGAPVNLVDVGEPASFPRFLDALAGGRVSVSTGPIVSFAVRDASGRRWGPGDRIPASGPLLVDARVQAPPWVPVPELRLVRNGAVIARYPLPEREEGATLDHKHLWTLDHLRAGWLLVEAGWPLEDDAPVIGGLFADVYPDAVPLAFTNPAWIEGAQPSSASARGPSGARP